MKTVECSDPQLKVRDVLVTCGAGSCLARVAPRPARQPARQFLNLARFLPVDTGYRCLVREKNGVFSIFYLTFEAAGKL